MGYKIGVIGCGNISSKYFDNLKSSQEVDIVACSDLNLEKAKDAQIKFGINKSCTVEELLSDKDISLIINLTIPKAHHEVSLAALKAGKHVYSEKPITETRESAKDLISFANKNNLKIACAPDTFLGTPTQTAIKAIKDGLIGEPKSAVAFLASPGWESWHPNPDFYYQAGGGPMLDMGPYYLTALIAMLGSVKRVTGISGKSFSERTITSEPKKGQKIQVNVNTHVSGSLEFTSGLIASLITSFDVQKHNLPKIEIYGTEGSLSVPNPNFFEGEVEYFKKGDKEWRALKNLETNDINGRGVGVIDLVRSISNNLTPRVSGDLAYHVLDCMLAFDESSESGTHIKINSSIRTPKLFLK